MELILLIIKNHQVHIRHLLKCRFHTFRKIEELLMSIEEHERSGVFELSVEDNNWTFPSFNFCLIQFDLSPRLH